MKRSLKWSPTLKARFLVLPLLVSFSTSVRAERLPIKAYTTADGLAHNSINKIKRDSRGFLWFCTDEGLSRFDGYTFTNYTTEHGLPHPNVTDFLETRGGEFWIGTGAGLVRINPKGEPGSRIVSMAEAATSAQSMFTVVLPEDEDRRARSVTALLEARDGTLWVGTLKGLYRLERVQERFALRSVEMATPHDFQEQQYVSDLLDDQHGSVWVATPSGLSRRWPDGTSAHYQKKDGLPDDNIHDLMEDHRGQLWAGTRYRGFFRFVADETHAPPSVAANYEKWDGHSGWVFQLFETADQRFWVASNTGLVEFFPDASEESRRFRVYTPRNGLLYHEIKTLNEDAGGNLWLGSVMGTMRLARTGFVTYDERDGLMGVTAILGDAAGGVCFRGTVIGDEHSSFFDGAKLDPLRTRDTYYFRYGRFDGQQFSWFLPDVPSSQKFGWVMEGVTLQTRNREWWLGTGDGLYRFPATDDFTKIKHARPLAVYQTKEKLSSSEQVFRIFETSRGDVWASTIARPNGLAFWERASETWRRDLADAPGLPPATDNLARSFGEDRAGNVWIGFSTGVARYRDGKFTFFGAKDGVPPGAIQDIFSDLRGRIWQASSRGGLIRVDNPEAEHPTFRTYTTAQGLSSNSTSVITEDLAGHIYVGTGRGLDRLDPETGRVKSFTTADGLTSNEIIAAFRAPDGALWFGLIRGLARFMPEADSPPQSPPVFITTLNVAGVRQAISSLGETEFTLPDLVADQNHLQIDFVGLSFAPGEVLRYQYLLEGASAEWATPTEQRTVNFASLAPGSYRFMVRAVNSDGIASLVPASITFKILRPVWQRWWFISLAALAVAGLAYAAYRYRISRLLEVVNVRTRIATDLHDDIGANLTKIAILSEVARQELGTNGAARAEGPLSSIARISRESVASMSDIVWAINPMRDHLLDLVRRMREHGEELFALRDIEFRFNAPETVQSLKLGVDVRRDLLLIFKEAVNNAARHSRCTNVSVDLLLEGSQLLLTVADDGAGFEEAARSDGQGLSSMRLRAERLGGRLEVETKPGRGTTIRLAVPLPRSASLPF